ncbi:MAG: carboxypeptidase regulatory-like domain-containing protein [Planctomycetota bacterium]|nr:MAG: carboxypeptidase regulatory-like domain-containing protein [Planctomycetota bacterium]
MCRNPEKNRLCGPNRLSASNRLGRFYGKKQQYSPRNPGKSWAALPPPLRPKGSSRRTKTRAGHRHEAKPIVTAAATHRRERPPETRQHAKDEGTMRLIGNISSALVGMATVGLAFPQIAAVADVPAPRRTAPVTATAGAATARGKASTATSPRSLIRDVKLDENGRLSGHVAGTAGTPSRTVTVFTTDGKPVSRAHIDERGGFTIDGLRPGLYRIATADAVAVYRVWSSEGAPPAAGHQVELRPVVVRAQNAPPDVLFDEQGNPYGRVRVSDAPMPPQTVPDTGAVLYEPAPAVLGGPDIFTLATLGAAVTGAVLGGVALHEAQKGGPASP